MRSWLEDSVGGFFVIYFGTPIVFGATFLFLLPNPPDSIWVIFMVVCVVLLGWYAATENK